MKIKMFNQFSLNESNKSRTPKFSKGDIESFFIDLLDDDIFEYDPNINYKFKNLYFKDNRTYGISLIPFGATPCYLVELKVKNIKKTYLDIPASPGQPHLMVSDIEFIIDINQKLISTREKAKFENLDFYYAFDGIKLKMLFIEND